MLHDITIGRVTTSINRRAQIVGQGLGLSVCAGCDSTRGLCAIEKGLKKRLTLITIAHPVFRYKIRLSLKNKRFPVYCLVDKERIAPPCAVDNFNSLFYSHFADRLPTRSSSHLPTALGGLPKPRPVLASTNSTRILRHGQGRTQHGKRTVGGRTAGFTGYLMMQLLAILLGDLG